MDPTPPMVLWLIRCLAVKRRAARVATKMKRCCSVSGIVQGGEDEHSAGDNKQLRLWGDRVLSCHQRETSVMFELNGLIAEGMKELRQSCRGWEASSVADASVLITLLSPTWSAESGRSSRTRLALLSGLLTLFLSRSVLRVSFWNSKLTYPLDINWMWIAAGWLLVENGISNLLTLWTASPVMTSASGLEERNQVSSARVRPLGASLQSSVIVLVLVLCPLSSQTFPERTVTCDSSERNWENHMDAPSFTTCIMTSVKSV